MNAPNRLLTRSRLRFRVGLLAFGLLAAGLAFWIVSRPFERWLGPRVARLLENRLSAEMGVPVQLGEFQFSLLPLEVEVRDLKIASAPADGPPLVRASSVRTDLVGALQLLRRQLEVELREVRIEGLELNLAFDSAKKDFLPTRQRVLKGPRLIALRLGYVELTNAALVLRDHRVSLDLRARGVEARAVSPGLARLDGLLEAESVELSLPRAKPVSLRVAGRFALFPDRLEIRKAKVSGNGLVAEVAGPIRWQPFPRGVLEVQADVGHRFFEELGYLDGDVSGKVRAEGSVSWERAAWGVRAEIEAGKLDLFGYPLSMVHSSLVIGRNQLELPTIRANYRNGEVRGRFFLDLASSRPVGTLDLDVTGVPIDAALEQFSVPIRGLAATVSGPLHLELDASRPSALSGWGSFSIRPNEFDFTGSSALGRVDVAFDRGDVRLLLPELWLPDTRLEGGGEYRLRDRSGSFAFRIATEALPELLAHVSALNREVLWFPESGRGQIQLSLELFKVGNYRLQVEALELHDVRARGFAADTGAVSFTLTPGGLELTQGVLRRGPGRLQVAGRIPFGTGEPLELNLLAEGWALAQVQPWVELPVELSGPFFGSALLTGTADQLAGRAVGRVEGLDLSGWAFGPVAFELEWDGARIALVRAELEQWGADAFLSGLLDRNTNRLEVFGKVSAVPLERLRGFFAPAALLDGELQLELVGQGTLERPEINLQAQLWDWRLRAGSVGNGASLPARLTASLLGPDLEFELDLPELASLRCRGGWNQLNADLRCRARAPRLASWSPLFPEPFRSLEGELTLDGRFLSAADRPAEFTGQVTQLHLQWKGRRFNLAQAADLVLQSQGLELGGLFLEESDRQEELFLIGRVPWPGAEGSFDLRWQFQVAAEALAHDFEGIEVEGNFIGIGRMTGGWDSPRLRGQIAWERGRLRATRNPSIQPLEDLEAWFALDGESLVLEEARGRFAGGLLRARGRLEPGAHGLWGYRLDLSLAESSPRLASGWSLRGGADLVVLSTADGRQIRGEVEVQRAEYTQELRLSPGELLARVLARSRVEAGEADPWMVATELAIRIVGRDALRVRNRMARFEGGGDLDLRGTLARPVLFGEVSLREGGTVNFGGNRYEIVRGRFRFTNPIGIDPALDIVVRTRREEYDITVELGGTLARLETAFRSNPPLPDLEVLALLSGGEVDFATAPSSTGDRLGSPAQVATSIVYGQAANLVTERVSRLFRLDTLRIDPLTSGDGLSSARLVVGKRISRDLWVTYREDPTSTAQRVLEVEWRLSDRWKVFFTQNGNNSYALDLRWETRF